MTKEEAASVLDLLACDLCAAEKEEGYDFYRYQLREALELAVEVLREESYE